MKTTIEQSKRMTMEAIPEIGQIIYQGGKEKLWFFKFDSEYDMTDETYEALSNEGFNYLDTDRELNRRNQTIIAKRVI